jgi:hypothetical protein
MTAKTRTISQMLAESRTVTRIVASPWHMFVSLEIGTSYSNIWVAEHIEDDYIYVYGLTPQPKSMQIRNIAKLLPQDVHTSVRRLIPYTNPSEKNLLIRELQTPATRKLLLDLTQFDPFQL